MRTSALALLLPLLACGSSTGATGSPSGTTAAAATTASSTGAASTGSSSSGTHGTAAASTTTGATGASSSSGTASSTATTTSTSGSTTSSGGSSTGGTPITAPSQQWSWVPFDNAFCGNGTATGIGVNLNPGSTQVLIYLEGGGACSDELTCYTLMTASYFTTGYGSAEFTTESADITYLAEPGGFFDRSASANPFQNYSYVYVPYCTGDLHAGDAVTQLTSGPANFVGYANLTAYLQRVVPTFPSATQVVLAGSSAGGFGAMFNWWHVQQAFGSTPVLVIDDSGTFMPPDILADSAFGPATSAPAWNLAATTPPGCTGCAADDDALYAFDAQTFPTQRGALLSYNQDSVLPTFDGITEPQFTSGLEEELTNNFAPYSNLGYFVFTGSGHVLWFTPQLTVNGVTLQTWVTQLVTGSSSWQSQQ